MDHLYGMPQHKNTTSLMQNKTHTSELQNIHLTKSLKLKNKI